MQGIVILKKDHITPVVLFLISQKNGQNTKTLGSVKSYAVIAATTGHSNEHSAIDTERLSRYSILSHQAGILFFSPESYPAWR
jgi:hypothetical protein